MNHRNVLITIPSLVIAMIIGAVYNKVTDYISLLGGFITVTVCYVMPCKIIIKPF